MVVFAKQFFLILAALVFVSAPVQAGPEEDLLEYVDKNTQRLVDKLNEERGLYERDPEAFYSSMDKALSGFVDFRRIAARVMGRYARQTTPEQRDEFVVKFKQRPVDDGKRDCGGCEHRAGVPRPVQSGNGSQAGSDSGCYRRMERYDQVHEP